MKFIVQILLITLCHFKNHFLGQTIPLLYTHTFFLFVNLNTFWHKSIFFPFSVGVKRRDERVAQMWPLLPCRMGVVTETHLIIATAGLSIFRSGSCLEGAPSYICAIDRPSPEAAGVHALGMLC